MIRVTFKGTAGANGPNDEYFEAPDYGTMLEMLAEGGRGPITETVSSADEAMTNPRVLDKIRGWKTEMGYDADAMFSAEDLVRGWVAYNSNLALTDDDDTHPLMQRATAALTRVSRSVRFRTA